MNDTTTENPVIQEKERRMVQIPSELLPFIEQLKTTYGYERDSTAVNNCIRLARNVFEKGISEFLTVLNGDASP